MRRLLMTTTILSHSVGTVRSRLQEIRREPEPYFGGVHRAEAVTYWRTAAIHPF